MNARVSSGAPRKGRSVELTVQPFFPLQQYWLLLLEVPHQPLNPVTLISLLFFSFFLLPLLSHVRESWAQGNKTAASATNDYLQVELSELTALELCMVLSEYNLPKDGGPGQ